jgi:deoxyribonuclease-4
MTSSVLTFPRRAASIPRQGRAEVIGATGNSGFHQDPESVAGSGHRHGRGQTIPPGVAEEPVCRAAVAHDSYLINLASPDLELRARSIKSFIAELQRCQTLGIRAVVSHPGNYLDDRGSGLSRNAESYIECLEAVPGSIMVLLETTAGTGTALGSSFEELAEIRAKIPSPLRKRIGFCADTCHLYAAGYDLVRDYEGIWQRWDDLIGLKHLRCLHLNDSKTPLGSRRDRHELIGEGSLGPSPFRRIMTDPRFSRVMKVLETPKGDDLVTSDRKMLRRLRAYGRRGGSGAR